MVKEDLIIAYLDTLDHIDCVETLRKERMITAQEYTTIIAHLRAEEVRLDKEINA